MTVNLEYDEQCWVCDGKGMLTPTNSLFASYADKDTHICRQCKGIGKEITKEGEKLISFLARHRLLG